MGESKDFGGAAFRRRTVVAAVARLACMLAWWGIGGWLSGPSACGAEPAGSAAPEGDALEEAVFRLGPLAEMRVNVEERMGHDPGQGFGARLTEAREKLDQGNEALQREEFTEAKACYEAALAAAGWVRTNASLRAEAREKRGAASELRRKALENDGPHLGLTAWREGERKREAAMAAYEAGNFAVAGVAWDAAAEAYGRSGTAARAIRVEQGLEAARGARLLGAWEEVAAAAGDVLEIDPANSGAQVLMGEAKGRGIAVEDAQLSGTDEPKQTAGMTVPRRTPPRRRQSQAAADAPRTPEPVPPPAVASHWRPFQIGIAGSAFELFPDEFKIIGLRLNLLASRNDTVGGIDVGLASLGKNINGIRVNLYNGSTYRFRGIEAGFINNDDSFGGIAVSAFNIVDTDAAGIQIGFLNAVRHASRGIQIGCLNGCDRMSGVQVGVYNFATSLRGIQIGLFNIVDEGPLVFFPFINMGF